uniref:Uncharacterized protein n=1 Tax=Anopheles dirus TaxID=7168 RepID=A0A182NW06_9DIPT
MFCKKCSSFALVLYMFVIRYEINRYLSDTLVQHAIAINS